MARAGLGNIALVTPVPNGGIDMPATPERVWLAVHGATITTMESSP